MAILGEAVIRANGKELRSEGGAVLDPGGEVATGHDGGGRRHGLSFKYKGPNLQVTLSAAQDTDIIKIKKDLRDATVVFDGNNGLRYMLTGCGAGDGWTLNEDSGQISGTIEATDCKKA